MILIFEFFTRMNSGSCVGAESLCYKRFMCWYMMGRSFTIAITRGKANFGGSGLVCFGIVIIEIKMLGLVEMKLQGFDSTVVDTL